MIGRTLSHYRVLGKLGEGGMGEVYQAEDTRLKRQVALKVLPEGMARDPERLRRFQREAEAIASLSHPGIVTIFSVEEAEGVHFLTMELVSGRRLDEMVSPGGMALDLSPQKDQDYFCEGIAEDIINALSKIGDLRVASRMSAFRFASRTAEPAEVGERLDVETVLSGSVRKAGQRVRISAELVNARDGCQLWSERYDRDLEDVFEVQDEISSNIVRALEVTLSPREKKAIQRPAPVNFRAYEFYLRGRNLFHRGIKATHAQALQMFTRAIEIDPDFAAAHAGMADVSSYARMYYGGSETDLERADEASRKALELAPDLAEAHASRGLALSLQDRHKEAEEAFETAIRLDPQLFEAHYFYGRSCWQQGKLDEAAKRFEEAMKVRPEDFQAPCLLGSVYNALGQPDKHRECLRRGHEIIEKHLELNPDDARALYLGSGCLIAMGETERGLEWASRAVAIDPGDTSVLYNVACTYCEAGRVEEALDYLEKAVAAGFFQKEWIVNDGDLDALRDNPRYKALIEGM